MVLCPLVTRAQNGTDTTTVVVSEKKPVAETANGRQLRLGFDIGRLLSNSIYSTRKDYELMLDMYLHKELYLVAEGGFGNGVQDYDNLKYKSDNVFFRAGFDKYMFPRKNPDDWNGAFVGLRYGIGLINRTAAWYKTDDGFGGITTGTTPGAHFTAHWFELTGGMRVLILPGVFAGWNIRGRFLLNQKSFDGLSPAYIAGYGQGDKQAVFDFNFYLSYAIRWGLKPAVSVPLK